MSDYAFVHEGKAYTPNGTDLAVDAAADHNAQLERAELARWAEAPDRMLAYYHFPAENLPLFGRPRVYRENFRPCLYTFVNVSGPYDQHINNGRDHEAYVSTWPGTRIGTITAARVYRHNFGGRFVSLRVRGTNGAEYHGRASWDWGQCVMLRKVKGGK